MSLVVKDIGVWVSTSTADAFTSGQDISHSVTRVDGPNFAAEFIDDTHMGQSNRSRTVGLGDATLNIDLLQVFSTAQGANEAGIRIDKLSKDLYDLSLAGSKFHVAIRPVKSVARSSDNPDYAGLFTLGSHQPFGGGGEIGNLLKNTWSMQAGGDITRRASSS